MRGGVPYDYYMWEGELYAILDVGEMCNVIYYMWEGVYYMRYYMRADINYLRLCMWARSVLYGIICG